MGLNQDCAGDVVSANVLRISDKRLSGAGMANPDLEAFESSFLALPFEPDGFVGFSSAASFSSLDPLYSALAPAV